jgi:hypothetical protein
MGEGLWLAGYFSGVRFLGPQPTSELKGFHELLIVILSLSLNYFLAQV